MAKKDKKAKAKASAENFLLEDELAEFDLMDMEEEEGAVNINDHVIEDNDIEYFIIGDNNTIHIHNHYYPEGKETEIEVSED